MGSLLADGLAFGEATGEGVPFGNQKEIVKSNFSQT